MVHIHRLVHLISTTLATITTTKTKETRIYKHNM